MQETVEGAERIVNKEPKRPLLLEARHTLSIEAARAKSASVATSLFLPKELARKRSEIMLGQRHLHGVKRLCSDRRLQGRSKNNPADSFPITRHMVSHERVQAAVRCLRNDGNIDVSGLEQSSGDEQSTESSLLADNQGQCDASYKLAESFKLLQVLNHEQTRSQDEKDVVELEAYHASSEECARPSVIVRPTIEAKNELHWATTQEVADEFSTDRETSHETVPRVDTICEILHVEEKENVRYELSKDFINSTRGSVIKENKHKKHTQSTSFEDEIFKNLDGQYNHNALNLTTGQRVEVYQPKSQAQHQSESELSTMQAQHPLPAQLPNYAVGLPEMTAPFYQQHQQSNAYQCSQYVPQTETASTEPPVTVQITSHLAQQATMNNLTPHHQAIHSELWPHQETRHFTQLKCVPNYKTNAARSNLQQQTRLPQDQFLQYFDQNMRYRKRSFMNNESSIPLQYNSPYAPMQSTLQRQSVTFPPYTEPINGNHLSRSPPPVVPSMTGSMPSFDYHSGTFNFQQLLNQNMQLSQTYAQTQHLSSNFKQRNVVQKYGVTYNDPMTKTQPNIMPKKMQEINTSTYQQSRYLPGVFYQRPEAYHCTTNESNHTFTNSFAMSHSVDSQRRSLEQRLNEYRLHLHQQQQPQPLRSQLQQLLQQQDIRQHSSLTLDRSQYQASNVSYTQPGTQNPACEPTQFPPAYPLPSTYQQLYNPSVQIEATQCYGTGLASSAAIPWDALDIYGHMSKLNWLQTTTKPSTYFGIYPERQQTHPRTNNVSNNDRNLQLPTYGSNTHFENYDPPFQGYYRPK